MSCLTTTRCKTVPQGATSYKLYINSAVSATYDVIIQNCGSQKKTFVQKVSVTETVNTLSLTYILFTWAEMLYFLISKADFIITVVNITAKGTEDQTELYIMKNTADEHVYTDAVLVNFVAHYTPANVLSVPTGFTTITFEVC